ncbi:MAG: hypothetical protein DI630_00485 [Gordonia sp. (in: high G+C Gram-positive bacteria)]|nr:MAG: hypothetical protein DI630_00485 [Gordonia sp. (in: high G+C Gram-positive bacteria)]
MSKRTGQARTGTRVVTSKIAATTKAVRVPAKVTTRRGSVTVTQSSSGEVRTGGGRVAADDPVAQSRVTVLLETFSRAELAELVGVSPSQTSRWASGKERPGPAAAPVLIDLEHVYARARLVWGKDTARIWLGSTNAHLGGARPLDVLITDGPAQVLEALDAEMWGGAA